VSKTTETFHDIDLVQALVVSVEIELKMDWQGCKNV